MLRNGQAVKPSSWRGYVERIDKALEAEYDSSRTYSVNSIVSRGGLRYICITGVSSPEAFDINKWARIENDRYIVFVDADDEAKSANPSAIYLGTVLGVDAPVSYTRLAGGANVPNEVKSVHSSWVSCPTPVDMPDDELFTALVSDSWESGQASDYETQRVGGGGRW